MTIWAIFISAYFVGFSGALVPGPLLTVTVNESFRRGFRAGPQLITGHAILEIGIVALIATGFYRFVSNDTVFGTVALIGGIFIAWMGWQLTKGTARQTIRLELDAVPSASKLGPLSLGALTSLANPYFIMWWLTIGAGYVVIALGRGLAGLAAFTAGHLLSDYTWYSLVSGAVGGGRRYFNQKIYRAMVFCCGLFLLALAVYFVRSGMSFLLA
jgi:threonine/homoserine/homoserine lactone efflux protein